MPTRDIKTRLVIEGENEYKAAISKINGELKLLDSALKETESRFQTNANSMEALQKKSDALTAVYEAQQRKVEETAKALDNARKAVDEYNQTGEDLKRRLEEENARWEALTSTKKASKKETKEHEKATGDLNRQINENNDKLEAAQKSAQGWETSLHKANTQLNNTQAELEETNGYLEEAKNSTDGCATSIDQFGNKAKEAGEKSNAALDALAANVAFEKINSAFRKVRETIQECVDASVEFESAMAGVAKTTDLTDDELAAMGDALQEMSTRIPTAASDLAAITEAAGQLGIEKDHLLEFTEVMANLGVATNLSAEEAASALAKFANVVKMDADNYDRLGSVIVALGNNFATTESDIVSMATRIASTGAIIDLTEPQIMAIATALSSVGIEAEAGGSAISKLLKNMEVSAKSYETANTYIEQTGKSLRELELLADQDSKGFKAVAEALGLTSGELKAFMEHKKTLEQFADVAGMTADEFINRWGEDAVQALDAFIVGLNDTDRTGKSAVETLNDMGLTEIRLSNAVLSLASNGHILTDSVNLANDAWRENTALTKEAETRYNTTESKLQLLDNSVQALKASVGDQLTPALRNLADTGIDAAKWGKDFIEQHEWVVPVIGGLASSLGALTAIIGGYIVATKTVIPIIQAFNTALAANPAALAAVAIGAVVAALAAFIELRGKTDTTIDELTEKTRSLADAANDSAEAYEKAKAAMETQDGEIARMIERVKELAAKEKLDRDEKEELETQIRRLNEAVPDLALAYDEETHSLNMSIEAMEKRIRLQRDEEKLTAAIERKLDLEEQLAKAEENNTALLETREELQQRIDQVTEKYTKNGQVQLMNRAYQEEIRGLKQEYAELGGAIQTSENSIESMRGQLDATKAEIEGYSSAVDTATESIEDLAEAEKEQAAAAEAEAEAEKKAAEAEDEAVQASLRHADDLAKRAEERKKQAEETKKRAEALRKAVCDAADITKERLQQLSDAYKETFESCQKSLWGMIDLWGDAKDKTEVSIRDMIDNMQEQRKAIEEYRDNLLTITQAMADGQIRLGQETLDMLTSGTEEAMRIAAMAAEDIANTGGELVNELSREQSETAALINDTSRLAAGMATDFENASQRITNSFVELKRQAMGLADGLHDAAYLSGSNFAAGFAQGINAEKARVVDAAENMTASAIRQVRRTQMEQSPAKVLRQSGAYFAEGYALGIGDKTPEAVKAAEAMAKAVQTPIERLRDRLQGIQSEIAAIVSAAAAQAQQQAASITSSVFQMQSALGGTSGGFTINYDNDTAPFWLGSGAYEPSAERIAALGWRLPDLTPQPLTSGGGETMQMLQTLEQKLDQTLSGGRAEEYLAVIAANSEKGLYVDGKTLVAALAPGMNRELRGLAVKEAHL